MQITKEAIVGTLESSDAMIKISPSTNIQIEINSSVGAQFYDDIKVSVEQILKKFAITGAKIEVEDKGALDCVLQARLKAAILRAVDQKVSWEVIL